MSKEENKFLETALYVSKEAGRILHRYYMRVDKIKTEYKNQSFDPASLVSEADVEVQKFIVRKLHSEFPDHGIWGEEKTKGSEFEKEYTWYIDPLDGTSNFLRKIPLWGVSIGLTKDRKPLVGVLAFPELDLIFEAVRGKGAYANSERIHVSERGIKDGLYFSRGYYRGKSYFDDRLASKFGQTKILDASSYELAQIAMGNGELYALNSVPYDVAAGVVIVEEAGGMVTDGNGRPWDTASRDIVVTNGKIHNEVLSLLRPGE